MLDLRAFKEQKIAELETTNPQRLAYFKLGIDSLIAGVQELARLGMVIEVNDASAPGLSEAERHALAMANGGAPAGASGNFMGPEAARAIASSIARQQPVEEVRNDLAAGVITTAGGTPLAEVKPGDPLLVPPGAGVEPPLVVAVPQAPASAEWWKQPASPAMAKPEPAYVPPVKPGVMAKK